MFSLLYRDPCGVHSAGRTFRGTYGERRTDERNRQTRPTLPKQNFRPDEKSKLSEKDVPIKLEEVDYKINENAVAHHTNEFDITQKAHLPSLVVRRGDPFFITLKFNKPYDEKLHDVRLLFEFGDQPIQTKGTLKDMNLSDIDKPGEWCAWIKQKKGNELTISITTHPQCCVGRWKFSVDIIVQRDNVTSAAQLMKGKDIYVLFNPWCKDDSVFLQDKGLRDEYVLNEKGRIYVGNYKRIRPRIWNFAQFQGNILDCAIYLLDESSMSATSRGDPVKVSRAISKMVNCQNDNGVLVGNWSGNYDDGISPSAWNGSEKILEEYYKAKEPVKYGQCWVFSGLVTSVCRALGIPARSVTNFASAHDTDSSVSIDSHYDEKGEPLEWCNTDSVWNFHVWNDVWMARPDLVPGYGGWQAIDATPQETSEGVFQCGPTSLEALRRGEVNLPYDGKFLFAEVNADRIHWKLQKDGTFRKVSVQKGSVGKYISTKSPFPKEWGGWTGSIVSYDITWWDDVTACYKHKEGSPEERAAVVTANSYCMKRDDYDEMDVSEDLKIKFKMCDIDEVYYGEDYEVKLQITNESDKDQIVGGCLTTSAMYYTGVPFKRIKMMCVDEKIVPKKKNVEITMKVTVDDYFGKLADGCHIKLSCQFSVIGTNVVYTEDDDFRLLKPDLNIKAQSAIRAGQAAKVEISFVNPLKVSLSGCKLHIEGVGLQKSIELPQNNVNPKGTFMTTVNITPVKRGKRELIANFICKEIIDVLGSFEFAVTE